MASIKKKPVDAVIVGFGWTGSIMAIELANAGLNVVALERGDARDTVPSFAYPQIVDEIKYSARQALLQNNRFGAGTQANTSGDVNPGGNVVQVNSAFYASNVTPWVDPANGDFRINLAAAKDAGRGNFTQTAASYAGTVGYPDIGAAQHQDTGGASGPVGQLKIFRGGTPY